MKIAVNKSRVRLYLWIGLAWFALWEFNNLANFPQQFWPRTVNEAWRCVYIVALNFLFFETVLPFVFRKKAGLFWRIVTAVFLFWAMAMLYSFGIYGWRALGIALGLYTPYRVDTDIQHGVAFQVQFSFASIIFFGVVRHLYDHRQLKEAAQKLRIEKQEAELNYLKSQTNPHFLFNTLNNIYSLARDKSDLAPESILRLSKILRYMLYEASGEYVAVEQELKVIGDYIALEQLRYDESLRVTFHYDVEDMRQAVPPLLLVPLVENAFKHGVSETRGQPFVDVHLSVRQRRLAFTVKNSSETAGAEQTVRENIGLSNLRRQLELLYTDYNLQVQQSAATFTATLTINLASHVETKMHHR